MSARQDGVFESYPHGPMDSTGGTGGEMWAFSNVQKVYVLPRMAAPPSPATASNLVQISHMPFPCLHRSKLLLDLLTILSIPRGSVATYQGSAEKFFREGKKEAIGLVTTRLWNL